MWFTVITLSGTALGLYIIRKIREYQWGYCRSKRLMTGKVVVITGGNAGLGKETAIDLVKRGACVVLACRSRLAAEEAIYDIRKKHTASGQLIFAELDLADLNSVKNCASYILEKFSHIDVLINNAGISIQPKDEMRTPDGHEVHFGVNYLGHFLLTHLLLDRLKETENSRILIVSSMLYKNGEVNFDKLTDVIDPFTKCSERRNPLYSNSKLENLLHAHQLCKTLKGSTVGVYTLCPGFSMTNMMRQYLPQMGWFQKICLMPVALFFMRSAKQGAQTTIHCAVSEELDNVECGFYRNCRPAQLLQKAKDNKTAQLLYEVSLKLVKSHI